jgi:putative transposase
MRFAFVDAEKASYPIALMCLLLEVSRAGYYEWRGRGPSRREREDRLLTVKIAAFHKRSRGIYGSPRIVKDLEEDGHHVGRKRVTRLMRAQGLFGSRPRPYRTTTDSDHDDPVAPNLVDRDFAPAGPDRIWAADITYVRTWQGWLYLAVVIDLWSRRVVGWSVADHMRTELVLGALDMALGHRQPRGVTHHSDRGSQYTSGAFQATLRAHGIKCSMS